MTRALMRATIARIVRTRRGRLPLVAWTLLSITLAIVTRSLGPTAGAGPVLVGPFGQAILPLAAYGIVSAVSAGSGLRGAIRGLVALGAPPERASFASVLGATLGSAAAGGLLAAVICLIAHGSSDPPLWLDLSTTFGTAFLGGAAYGAFFSAGSAIGRGAMRSVLLVIDFVLGSPAGFGALFVPRGHLLRLLGGPAVYELSARASSICLFLILAASFLVAVRLAGKTR